MRILIGTLLLSGVSLSAATLTADYRFSGNLNDDLGGSALTANGGTVGADVYSFAAGQGLSVAGVLADGGDYTVGMRFELDTVAGYRKFLDFKGRASDCGQYALNGGLTFYCGSSGGAFGADTVYDVVMTRDGLSGLYTTYINGVSALSFTSNVSIFDGPGGIMWFLRDDAAQNSEHSSGTVDRIVIYDGALTAAEVQVLSLEDDNLNGAVPEPSTFVLFGSASALTLILRRKRGVRNATGR